MGNYTFKMQGRSFGVISIPSIFIDKYMPEADGNFVKVYLAGLLEASNQGSMDSSFLSKKLNLLESDILKAWQYWESKGLVQLKRYNSSELHIEFLNITDFYSDSSGEKYTPYDISLRMSNPKIKDMFENIEKLIGRILSPTEISMYLSWLDDFKFTPEVIILLVEYCKSKGKLDFRYIEKVALNWHDENILSVEDAQKNIAQHEDKYNNYRLVLDFLGLKENDLMKPQQELLDKWFGPWGFSVEMVLEACKICSLRINEPNFSYIDGILSNWNKQGIKDIKDMGNEGKKKGKNVKFKAPVNSFNSYDQRSYDIKELEKKLLGRDGEADDAQ